MVDVLDDREKNLFDKLKEQFRFAVEVYKTSWAVKDRRLVKLTNGICDWGHDDSYEHPHPTKQDAEQVARHRICELIRNGLTVSRREGVARKICAALEKESVNFQRLFLKWIDYEMWRHAPNIYPDPRQNKKPAEAS